MINKNNKIQEIAIHFRVGLKPFPLFRFQIDTNRINAKGELDNMNQFSKWLQRWE